MSNRLDFPGPATWHEEVGIHYRRPTSDEVSNSSSLEGTLFAYHWHFIRSSPQCDAALTFGVSWIVLASTGNFAVNDFMTLLGHWNRFPNEWLYGPKARS